MTHCNEKYSMPPKRRLPATVHVANATSRLRADHFDEEAIAVERFEDSASTSIGAVVLPGDAMMCLAWAFDRAGLMQTNSSCGSHANQCLMRVSKSIPLHFSEFFRKKSVHCCGTVRYPIKTKSQNQRD